MVVSNEGAAQNQEQSNDCSEQGESNLNDFVQWLPYVAEGILHPITYVRTLMQLGYEPFAPRPGKSFWGRPVLFLPTFREYFRHIRNADGILGCYRGVTPRLLGASIGFVCSEKLAAQLGFQRNKNDIYKEDYKDISNEDLFNRFKDELKCNLVLTTSAVIVSHPFHVISVRMMAEFIGQETFYKSTFTAVTEIYKTEGLKGFFVGFVPRILAELICVSVTTAVFCIGKKYFTKDRMTHMYLSAFTQTAIRTFLYPFQVISTCMCVSGSRLAAGQPPFMPIYSSWLDCMRDLSKQNDLSRGTSVLYRSVSDQYRNFRRFDKGGMKTILIYRDE